MVIREVCAWISMWESCSGARCDRERQAQRQSISSGMESEAEGGLVVGRGKEEGFGSTC